MVRFLLLILFTTIQTVALLPPLQMKQNKKYQIAVCAVLGDNLKHLKEWIAYHQLIGVDHFYLYHYQLDRELKATIRSFIKDGLVTLIPWYQGQTSKQSTDRFMWPLSAQIPAYENAIYIRGVQETKWLICLNENEYIVPLTGDSIQEILRMHPDAVGFSLSTDCFQLSQRESLNDRFLIENTDLVALPKELPQKGVVKAIFQPEWCKGFIWPPYRCILKEGRKMVHLSRFEMRINRYVDSDVALSYPPKRTIRIRPNVLPEEEMVQLLEEGYQIEDQEQAIARFLPQLRKKMGWE